MFWRRYSSWHHPRPTPGGSQKSSPPPTTTTTATPPPTQTPPPTTTSTPPPTTTTTSTPPPTTTTTSTPPATTTTTSTPPPTTTTTSTPPPPTSPSVYWGANIGTQLTGGEPPWDWTAVNAFENTDGGGKTSSILHWGSMFYSSDYCAGACTFTTNIYQKVRDNGKIPFVSWSSQSSTGENGYTDAEIAAGSQDAYLTKWAQAAKAWGHPLFLRFDWEMNAGWFGWGVGANGNTAADYVAMWRHVHNIFTSVGANNVSWVWCPNIDDSPSFASLASLYPGDAYVDWTCLDGYNGDVPWTSFHNLFLKSYNEIAGSIAPSKPMIIGEVGTTETGGSKAQWITDMLNDLPVSFPKIHAFLWFDVNQSGPGNHSDWPIDSSSSSEAAFAKGIASPTYAGKSYSNLNTSPIPATP